MLFCGNLNLLLTVTYIYVSHEAAVFIVVTELYMVQIHNLFAFLSASFYSLVKKINSQNAKIIINIHKILSS